MTKKSVTQQNLKKSGNNNKQFKTSAQYKTFNQRNQQEIKTTILDIKTAATTFTGVFKTTLTQEIISKIKIRRCNSENNLSKYKKMKNIKQDFYYKNNNSS